MAVILSVVYCTLSGGMGLCSGEQGVILNSTPKAGVPASVKGLHKTLRVHLPAHSWQRCSCGSRLSTPSFVHRPQNYGCKWDFWCGCTNTFCTEPMFAWSWLWGSIVPFRNESTQSLQTLWCKGALSPVTVQAWCTQIRSNHSFPSWARERPACY